MIRTVTLALGLLFTSLSLSIAQISVVIDPPPISTFLDKFNDGIDTTTAFANASSAGEAGGVASVSVAADAPDPQFQVPTPGDPFDISVHPFFRLSSRGTVGVAAQVFPLPPSGATVVGFNTETNFAESAMTFVTDPPGASGDGLRIDPIPNGGVATDTFDYDYIILDKFQTIGLAEYDRDNGNEGFDIVGNGHIVNLQVSAATSTLTATTSGNDPVMQRTALAVDASIYTVLEIRAAFDPLSTSRFEVFWGTDINPGPAGGQSLVVTDELIRDGELHTYRFQMSDDSRWNNTLNILRIDPLADADAVEGRSFAIDYVRLIAGAPVLDTDLDGLPDAIETGTGTFVDAGDTGTDPGDQDTDGDGFDDGVEVASGTDPNDINSTPGAVLDGYSDSPAVYGLGAPIAPNVPVIGFGTPIGFSVSPDLPDGLTQDTTTGAITGSPTTVTAAADYTITASFDESPDSSFDLNIEVTNPIFQGYSLNPALYQRGSDIGVNIPVISGAAPDSFAVSPALPDGLSLDLNSGDITGIPTAFQAPVEYTITASYTDLPDAQITISIAIEASPVLVVDPAQAISNFVSLGEFNIDGDLEFWGSNNATITAAGGLLVVNTTAPDPQFFMNGLDLDTLEGEHTVLEFRLRQPDTEAIEFFWADGNGGLSGTRRLAIEGAVVPGDGEFHIYQIDMTGVFSGAVNVIRLDPGAGAGRTVEVDYVRLGDFTAAGPPRFTNIDYDTDLDEATITWTSTPGETFFVQSSDDMLTWVELDDAFPAAAVGETTSFLDVSAGGATRRYYRVVRSGN
jgi:hypothetical protein